MMIEKINEAVDFIRSKGQAEPQVGIILGTGLGKLVDYLELDFSLDYTDIPHFAESTVEFHSWKLQFGKLSGKQVYVMNGRFHF
jgi:purine-nucleoside phosphorylase